MKLDRNINPDGRGKYALINLRKNTVEWGGPENQFFVIKYKDRFAEMALRAYAISVRQYANSLGINELDEGERQRREWHEYADEIEREAELAKTCQNKTLPT